MTKKLRIRRAIPDDIEKVFELSNDPVVRACSIQNQPIAWETHVTWFNKALDNPKLRFYIIESTDGQFIAQVRFTKDEQGWIISISIHSKFRGKKLGDSVLRLALCKMPKETICAWIKETNIPSQRIFEKAGFCYSGTDIIEKENYLIYKYEE